MSSLATVIARVNGLRALTQSTNAHEAAAAARLADELISKYQLSEAELIVSGQQQSEPIEVIKQHLHESGRIMLWIHELADTLCNHYGCSYYIHSIFDPNKVAEKNPNAKRGTYKALVMVGRKSDGEIVQYMFDWLRPVVDELVRKNARGQGMEYSQNYARGVVNGIRLQLKAERDKLTAETTAASQSTAIVLLNNRAVESKAFMHEAVKLGKAPSSKLGRDMDAFTSGTEQGKQIKLNKGLNSGNDTKLLS